MLENGVPRFVPIKGFAGYVSSCIDITDIKQSHARFVSAHKLESLGLMAAGVAHDFGNVLGNISCEAELAMSGLPPDSSIRESLGRISSLVTHANELVMMLMDSAGGGIDPKALEPVDVSSVAHQIVRLLKPSVSKHALVETNLGDDLPTILGNAPQIRQVIVNLVNNASEAVGERHGVIRVSTQVVRLEPRHTGRRGVKTGRRRVHSAAGVRYRVWNEHRNSRPSLRPIYSTKPTDEAWGWLRYMESCAPTEARSMSPAPPGPALLLMSCSHARMPLSPRNPQRLRRIKQACFGPERHSSMTRVPRADKACE